MNEMFHVAYVMYVIMSKSSYSNSNSNSEADCDRVLPTIEVIPSIYLDTVYVGSRKKARTDLSSILRTIT